MTVLFSHRFIHEPDEIVLVKRNRIIKVFLLVSLAALALSLLPLGLVKGFAEIPAIFVTFHLIALLYLALFIAAFFLIAKLSWRFLGGGKRAGAESGTAYEKFKSVLFACLLTLGAAVLLISLLLPLLKPREDGRKKQSSIEALKSLPYLSEVPIGEGSRKEGVVKHDRAGAYPALNIYNPQNSATAYLLDMAGDVLHAWSFKLDRGDSWHHVEMDEDGGLLAIVRNKYLIKLAWDSRIEWADRAEYHHDVAVGETGDIYALATRKRVVFAYGLPVPIIDDYLVVFSPETGEKKEISFYELLKDAIPFRRIKKIAFWLINPKDFIERTARALRNKGVFGPADILHVNTVELIDRDIGETFRAGDVLFCSKSLDLIGVIDEEKQQLVWSWGTNYLDKPHHPTILEDGNILIYDNGDRRGYSRIIELEPTTGEIVWEYRGEPTGSFFSNWGGSNQRLPNGNTLIAESSKGHVFEVTETGEIVWEFYAPETGGKKKSRPSIYRMMRVVNGENYAFLQGLIDKRE